MSNASLLRLQQELAAFERNPDHQILLAASDDDLSHLHAVIMGPFSTPYCLGFFDFTIDCGRNYPTEAPKVLAKTTARGSTRFNPNIYACGKVCLSLLGTWRGDNVENWSAVHGLFSLCISIQSLMSDKPGYENSNDKTAIDAYNLKIMHETLRISICDRFEQILAQEQGTINRNIMPVFCSCSQKSPFIPKLKLMFLWYFDIYMESQKVTKGQPFFMARFEYQANQMAGTFDYDQIRRRLTAIHESLIEEEVQWLTMVPDSIANRLLIVENLQSQFRQISSSIEPPVMTLALVDNNPFHWTVTILGPDSTCYEGGLFEATMIFHPNFPEVPPRIRFQTTVYHPHVARSGIAFMSITRPADIRQYIAALCNLFTTEPDSSPATHLNLDAAELYFGDESKRRIFNRNARRCAQRSIE
eukprot:jgi/Hompol1/5256/HPOL_001931-RA